jgi:hypothetical protein
MRQLWSELKAARPGRRFRREYKRSHGLARHGAFRKVATIVGGAVLILAGVLLLVLPGPGIIVIGLGGALIATESHRAATALDVLELGARNAIRRVRYRLNQLTASPRTTLANDRAKSRRP